MSFYCFIMSFDVGRAGAHPLDEELGFELHGMHVMNDGYEIQIKDAAHACRRTLNLYCRAKARAAGHVMQQWIQQD